MSGQRKWYAKFGDAWQGIAAGVRGQSSFAVHGCAAVLVVVIAAILRVSRTDWSLLVFAIGLVMVSELFNSAVEWLARAVTAERDERIGRALDIAAGAVLLASLTAVVIGLLVLGPPLWARFAG